MDLWYRIFGAADEAPEPAGLEACIGGAGPIRFAADASGWYSAEVDVGGEQPLVLERFLADEDGMRAELNGWAGFLETQSDQPEAVPLMERAIQTRQLFTLHCPDASAGGELCLALCRHLAGATAGFYQIDGQGFFDAAGRLLVRGT